MTTTIPTIPTFVAGSTPTAAQLNQLGTAISFWANRPSVHAYVSAAQSGANVTNDLVAFDGELLDYSDPMHSPTTANSQLKAVATGRYEISGQITWAANATGVRTASVRLNSAASYSNGTLLYQGSNDANAVAGGITSIAIPPFIRDLVAGDYVEFFGYQNSGAALAYTAGTGLTYGTMKLIGT